MPSKKKKYNARFPAGRIKKIMQTDEEVGKVAQAVPIIISRTLELFVESLLTKTMLITESRNAKTLTPSHLKQCIQSESRFDFLKDLVRNIPDASVQEDNDNNAIDKVEIEYDDPQPEIVRFFDHPPLQQSPTLNRPTASNTTNYAAPALGFAPSVIARTPVIQYQPRLTEPDESNVSSLTHRIENNKIETDEPKIHIQIGNLAHNNLNPSSDTTTREKPEPPPLVPIAASQCLQSSSTGDNLYIDEDYDN